MNEVAPIAVHNLTKQYPGTSHPALKSLSLSVNKGEVYGFLGPNGAGKSTTIRTLLNFIQPTSGSASILGKDIVKDSVEIKRSIGYLAGDVAIYPKMTGKQYLSFLSELQPARKKGIISELAKSLHADLHKKLGELSRGNRQKIGIIQAFMHDPAVFILDEPTSGLDPLMQEVFYALLADAKQRGASIFMSSHILTEVQKTCDRVGIIREGKLVSERRIAEMQNEAAQNFEISFASKPPLAKLRAVKGVKKVQAVANNSVTLHMHGDLSPLFKLLSENKVERIEIGELNLEEEFMKFYADKDVK